MTSADLIRTLGETLYGEGWRARLCLAIGVNDRQMRRWLSGAHEPPQGVWDDLVDLCLTRIALLDGLIDTIDRHVAPQTPLPV